MSLSQEDEELQNYFSRLVRDCRILLHSPHGKRRIVYVKGTQSFRVNCASKQIIQLVQNGDGSCSAGSTSSIRSTRGSRVFFHNAHCVGALRFSNGKDINFMQNRFTRIIGTLISENSAPCLVLSWEQRI